ncbi:hypothetical protein GCM10011521_27620 [Arenimonas soli]|uniref:Uncharacterized protein n=1 Tax=Arenimonas soli TaxID=2269504 RepID=A0ABQ1HTQ5_9GAMM|nr:hypothetical protein [Arenimonas soli]GGA87691.1 hypothetical protein GCM10011521_27620 [Arenimonas soli]
MSTSMSLHAAILLAASSAVFAQAAPEPLYEKELKAAQDHRFGCFGQGRDDACAAMVAGYERAMNAPDATDAVRHALFGRRLQVVAVRGSKLREAGDVEAALRVLEPGYAAMVGHYEGGKHFHTVIENLRLQQEMVLALASAGRTAEAEGLLSAARSAADSVYAQRAQAVGNKSATELVYQAFVGSETLEAAIGEFFRDQSRAADAGGQAGARRALALAAYQRAEQWLRRKVEAGVRGGMDIRGDLRLSEFQLEQASLHLDGGAKKEAEDNFLSASAVCLYLNDDDVANFNLSPLQGAEVNIASSYCQRARLGWGLATGEAQKEIGEAVDKMVEQQLEIMREAAGS